MKRSATCALLGLVLVSGSAARGQDLALPNLPNSVKFAVIGDSGTGKTPQYDIGQQMARARARFPFAFVIMLGDNLYGRRTPADFVTKFERPYQALLDTGVLFYAALGNHDTRQSRFYKPWNMNGNLYYTYRKGDVRFYALHSEDMNAQQRTWLESELGETPDSWKIAYLHHPLYSSAARHGSSLGLRTRLEPLLIKHGVDVVFQGHDHVYERIRRQNGVQYFVAGASGQLRRGNLEESALTAVGFDREQTFMLVEIDGDVMTFQAVSRSGNVVDSGTVRRTPP